MFGGHIKRAAKKETLRVPCVSRVCPAPCLDVVALAVHREDAVAGVDDQLRTAAHRAAAEVPGVLGAKPGEHTETFTGPGEIRHGPTTRPIYIYVYMGLP